MYITELSIRRPVVAWVLSLILVVFGIFVFSKLPVRELPSGIQPPVVQIKIDYKSASANIIDEEVTTKIEEVIGGAEGIKNIDSKSEYGKSTINIEFDPEIDLDDVQMILEKELQELWIIFHLSLIRLKYLNRPRFTTTMWIQLSSKT